MRTMNAGQGGARVSRAFTLVEMMVVVAIIGVLIGILIPAISRVKEQAQKVKTQSVLSAISSGLEMFRSDQRIGGSYPPSFSDNTGGVYGRVENPYGGTVMTNIPMSGAGLLVWALVGADRLGTPGFKPFARRGGATNTVGLWALGTHAEFNGSASNSGAYALDDNMQPVQVRAGTYVDTSKVDITTANQNGKFPIPAELEAAPDSGQYRDYPMILDGQGFPILYYRADPAGTAMSRKVGRPGLNPRGVYIWEHNADLVATRNEPHGVGPPLLLRAGAPDHKMRHQDAVVDENTDLDAENMSFARYIWDMKITARRTPQRADSYLLITAGRDGVYGTGDDVANFDHNGK